MFGSTSTQSTPLMYVSLHLDRSFFSAAMLPSQPLHSSTRWQKLRRQKVTTQTWNCTTIVMLRSQYPHMQQRLWPTQTLFWPASWMRWTWTTAQSGCSSIGRRSARNQHNCWDQDIQLDREYCWFYKFGWASCYWGCMYTQHTAKVCWQQLSPHYVCTWLNGEAPHTHTCRHQHGTLACTHDLDT